MVILAGDGLAQRAPDAALSQLPASWISDAHSPARRHLDAANYLFADGHVKALVPARITTKAPSFGEPTFEVKP